MYLINKVSLIIEILFQDLPINFFPTLKMLK